jgi:cysteine synthase A
VAAALELIPGPHDGETVAVVLADSGLKYLSTDLWPAFDGERPEVTG